MCLLGFDYDVEAKKIASYSAPESEENTSHLPPTKSILVSSSAIATLVASVVIVTWYQLQGPQAQVQNLECIFLGIVIGIGSTLFVFSKTHIFRTEQRTTKDVQIDQAEPALDRACSSDDLSQDSDYVSEHEDSRIKSVDGDASVHLGHITFSSESSEEDLDPLIARYRNRSCVYKDGTPAEVPRGDHPDRVPSKFLESCDGDATKAQKMWEENRKWRIDNQIWKVHQKPNPWYWKIKEGYPHFCHGHSKDGYPISYENPGKFSLKQVFRGGCKLDDLVRNYTFSMEWYANRVGACDEIREAGGITKPHSSETWGTMAVLDVKGASFASVMSLDVLKYVKAVSKINSAHYPCTAKRAIIINSPGWIASVYNTFKPFLPRDMDVEIVGSDYIDVLRRYIDDDQIPVEYGGSSPYPLNQHPYELDWNDLVRKANNEEIPNRPEFVKPADASSNLERTACINNSTSSVDNEVATYLGGNCIYEDGRPAAVPPGHSKSVIPHSYLERCEHDKDAAQKMWLDTQKWRIRKGVWKIHTMPNPRYSVIKVANPHSCHGYSKCGFPVVYEQLGLLNLETLFHGTCTNEELLHNFVFFMESVLNRICGSELPKAMGKSEVSVKRGLFYVFDLKKCNFPRMIMCTSLYKFLQKAMPICADHYPSAIKKVLIINAPMWMVGGGDRFTSIFRDVVEIQVHGADYSKVLQDFIAIDQIPPEYEGRSPFKLGHHPFERTMFMLAQQANCGDESDACLAKPFEGDSAASTVQTEPLDDSERSYYSCDGNEALKFCNPSGSLFSEPMKDSAVDDAKDDYSIYDESERRIPRRGLLSPRSAVFIPVDEPLASANLNASENEARLLSGLCFAFASKEERAAQQGNSQSFTNGSRGESKLSWTCQPRSGQL